jgi:predicted amidohydrolase YtcJ
MTKLFVLALLFIALAVGFAQQGGFSTPDAIFYNGKVVTVDSNFSVQQAFAIKGEEFAAVGTSAKVRALAGKSTRLVDLHGATVVPGLSDNHDHLYASAKVMRQGVDLVGVTSTAEVLSRLRPAVAKAKPGETVFTTVGWRAQLTRKDLDQVSADVPIVALRSRRGNATLNTAAFKAAGISRENPVFDGVPVPRDASGELTGAAPDYPQAMVFLDKLIPPPSQAEEEAMILKGQQERQALGMTTIRELSLWPDAMRAYYRVWRDGKLAVRVSMALDLPFASRSVSDLTEWGVGPGFGDHWLRLDSISEEPFAPLIPLTQFTDIALAVNRLGWRFAPHVGADPGRGIAADDVLNDTLAAYEAADRDQSIRNRRWIMEHIPLATPDQLDRVAKLGVVVSVQEAGYNGNLEATIRAVGKERAERQNPLRDMLDRHLIVVAGSDYGGPTADDPHPNDPFQKFYYYVTRKTKDGTVIGPQEAISREEALRMFTVNSAYATFEEKVKGSIEAGKLADFVILSQDLMTVPDDKILSTHALATYVGGRKVFSAENANF